MNSWGSDDGPSLNNDNALPGGRPSGTIIQGISAIIYSSKFPRTLEPRGSVTTREIVSIHNYCYYSYHFHRHRHCGSFAVQNRPNGSGGGKPFYNYRLEKKKWKVRVLPGINYHYYYNKYRRPNIWTNSCTTNINRSQKCLPQIRFLLLAFTALSAEFLPATQHCAIYLSPSLFSVYLLIYSLYPPQLYGSIIFLGLPRNLFPCHFRSIADLAVRLSPLFIMCPNHCNFCPLINLIIDATLTIFYSSYILL